MSRQSPADVLEPALTESLAQLDRQVFDFETLADAQTEGDHGTIICDALEIADLIVVLVTFDHHLDQAASFEQRIEQAFVRGWPDYSRRALHIFRGRIARERRHHLRMRLQSAIAPAELFRSQLERARLVANHSDLPLLHVTLRLDHALRELNFPIVEEED